MSKKAKEGVTTEYSDYTERESGEEAQKQIRVHELSRISEEQAKATEKGSDVWALDLRLETLDCAPMSKKVLRFGLPKGSLQDATIEKMAKAGYNISVSSRSYIPYVDDEELEIRMIRAQEISRYVEHGYLDCGITGYDWIQENGSKVHEVGEFQFSKVTRQPARWVLAVPENSPIKSVKDLRGKRIATEVVNLTRKYLRRHKVKAEVEFSWGATEVKAHELVDAIVEITETGSSLRANKLRIVDTLLVSTP